MLIPYLMHLDTDLITACFGAPLANALCIRHRHKIEVAYTIQYKCNVKLHSLQSSEVCAEAGQTLRAL